jgi:hypothetical protein
MTSSRVLNSALLAAGALLLAACASQPNKPGESLDDKYFQREANNYQKFEYDGQTVYCKSASNTASLIPLKHCIGEVALRQRVADSRRSRNEVSRGGPPYVATVPGGSGT